jgi:predicted nucleic acid-binding protein
LISFFDEDQKSDLFNDFLEQIIDQKQYDFYMPTVILSEIFKHFYALVNSKFIADKVLNQMQSFIQSNFIIVPLDIEEAIISANIKNSYSTSQRPLSYNDCFIAATAKILNADLITDDGEFFVNDTIKDTSRIEGLKVFSSKKFLQNETTV